MKTKATKPTLFIASSSAMLPVARALRDQLVAKANARVWDDPSMFLMGDYLFERLLIAATEFDFGAFIFGGDDIAVIKGEAFLVARDNVLLEAGIFAGRLGRQRTLLIVEQVEHLHLPSDLDGLLTARFTLPADLSDDDALKNSIGSAANKITVTMKARGIARSTVKALSPGMVFVALCLLERGHSLEELGSKFMWFEKTANRLAPVNVGLAYASKAAKYACQCLEALGRAVAESRVSPRQIGNKKRIRGSIMFHDFPTRARFRFQCIDLTLRDTERLNEINAAMR